MNPDQLMAAIGLLARCNHFDESRRAAALLPDDLALPDLLAAADGVQQIARALDTRRRLTRSRTEHVHDAPLGARSLYR